jgi:hypothetical protein
MSFGVTFKMDSYNFWQDLFDTYQSLPDWLKALWLIVPPAFVFGLTAMLLRPRFANKQPGWGPQEQLIYTIYCDKENQLRMVSHSAQFGGQQALLLLEPPVRESSPEASGK